MNWDDLRHFAALAADGSLSAAARRLGVEHATVARRIAALEEALGVALVDRRGRRWTPTAEGRRIAAIAARMEDEATAVRRVADGSRSALVGTVVVSAPPALAARRLTGPLVALTRRHPALTVRLVVEARAARLDRSEADVAIRLSRPEDGDVTIVQLGTVRFGLYASPAYLAAHAEADRRFVGYDGPAGPTPQQSALEDVAAGRPFALRSNSLDVVQAAAAAGAGVAALPDFMAEEDSRLMPVPPGAALLTRPVWLVVHSDVKRAAPVRAVVEALKTAFADRA